MKKDSVRKPSTFMYGAFVLASKLLSKFVFNLKYDKKEFNNVQGPCVIIANHESSIDFIFLAAALGKKAHFVISNSFYQINPIKRWLNAAGVIPKQQFQTSITDMRKIKSSLENNIPLAIYPAGMMSEDGITTPIPLATGKSLKWLGQDVYVAYTEGSYLTNPKWGKKWRKGQINIKVYKLFDKEQLKTLDPNEAQRLVEEALYYDAYKKQEELMIPYKHADDINGLESVLYWCPKCNSYHTNEVKNNNTLVCNKCGNTAIANKYGFLEKVNEDDVIFKHPSDWSKTIKSNLKEEITNTENFTLQDNCEIQMINFKKRKFEPVGSGTISLNKDYFEFTNAKLNGQEFNKKINTINFPILPFKPGKHFEIQDGNNIYRIILNKKEDTVKWISALEIFYQNNKLNK